MSCPPEAVLDYWIGALDANGLPAPHVRRRWFQGGPAVDEEIGKRFGETLDDALAGRLEDWAGSPGGAVALVVVLDQFSRNVHRGNAAAFAGDERALALARSAVESGSHERVEPALRYFLYMPFEHAEDRDMQQWAVDLFGELASASSEALFAGGVDYARRHQRVIERFGRFPARNAVLGRVSTASEIEYLKANPSGF